MDRRWAKGVVVLLMLGLIAAAVTRHNLTREDINLAHPLEYETACGTARTQVTLACVITQIAGANRGLLITPEAWTIGGNLTIPATIPLQFAPGGTFAVSTGFTVTINSRYTCPISPCFTGLGSVVLGTGHNMPFLNPLDWDGTDLAVSFAKAVNALPATGGHLILSPRTYTIDTPLLLDAGTKEYISVHAYGTSILTTSGASAGMIIRGGGTGGRAVYGLRIDHNGNATPDYGFSMEQSNNVHLVDTLVYYGSKSGYSAYRFGQSNPADSNTGAFWSTLIHPHARMKSGGTAGTLNNGIRMAGSGGNASIIVGGQFNNAVNGALLTHNGTTTTVPNGVTFIGTDFENNTTGVRLAWVDNSVLLGQKFIGLRGEVMDQFFAFEGTGTAIVNEGPYITGTSRSAAVTELIYMPGQNILPLSLNHGRVPDDGPMLFPKGLVIHPFGGSEKAIEVASPGGGTGIDILSGALGTTTAVRMAWTGTGTQGRLNSGAADNLRLSTIQSLSRSTTEARNLVGTVTISEGNTAGAVTFATAEPDASYLIFPTVNGTTGAPAAGSTTVASVTSKATAGFTLNLEVAPGAGASVTFVWLLIRI